VIAAQRVPAVGGEHVAVDPHRALAEQLGVDGAAQRAADEPLDLHRAAVDAPLRRVARLAAARRRREHPVLRGHPAVPRPSIQRGTDSSTDAVQMTRVSPCAMSAEPVAVGTKPVVIVVGRSWAAVRS
jgi:hypothetical protein